MIDLKFIAFLIKILHNKSGKVKFEIILFERCFCESQFIRTGI